MRFIHLLAAGAATIAVAAPASAQQAYPYPYAQPYAQPVPQPYPGQPGYGYAQPGYGYAQPGYAQPGYAQPGYAQPYGTNPIEQIVNQLLGNNTRYTVSDRTAVSRCASAALSQAQAQYGARNGAYGQQGYDPRYANNGYNNAWSQMRVSSITDVQRRQNSTLRVTGLISTGAYAQPYGNAYGYQNQGYADPRYTQRANLSFRCNVDYRGAVTGVRISRANTAYRR